MLPNPLPSLPPKAWEKLTDPRVLIVALVVVGLVALAAMADGVYVTVITR
jgi:hypothetical protein